MNVIVWTVIGAALSFLGGLFNSFSGFNTFVLQRWAKLLLWSGGVKLSVEGLEHLDKKQSYVIISNHQSHIDIPVALAGLPIAVRIISKKELFKIPIFGWGMKAAGILSIDRSNRKAAIKTLQEASTIAKKNAISILVFPEGTRSNDGKIHSFKKGPFILAIQSGLKILPISISGTRNILPKGKRLLRPGKARINIQPPIATNDTALSDRQNLLEKVREKVTEGFIENYQ